MEQIKQRVKQICSRRISQFATDIDRVVRPKGNSIREILNVSNVQRQIPKVIGRLDFQLIAVDVNQAAKGTHREENKAGYYNAFREVVASACRKTYRWSIYDALRSPLARFCRSRIGRI